MQVAVWTLKEFNGFTGSTGYGSSFGYLGVRDCVNESLLAHELKGLFHPAFLARVISWLAFVRRHFRGP